MDSYPSYGQWTAPYSPHPPNAPLLPPPPPLPPPPRQSHPESPNFYGRSSQSGGQRQDYHHYSHHQDRLPEPAVNQMSPYYSQHPPPQQQQHPPHIQQQHPQYIPQHVYEHQRISQPSSSTIPCTESRDIPQSAWVGFKEKRHDSWAVDAGQGRMDAARSRVDAAPGHNYQYDYNRSSKDSLGISIDLGLDGTSRSRDEFCSFGYARKESGATRIEGNYQDRGQLKSDSDRYFRGLDGGNRGSSSSVGYCNDRYGVTVSRNMTKPSESHEGVRNQRWDEARDRERTLYTRKKGVYNHSVTERYFDQGRRENSNELNQTPGKQMQKKSALLRLETPRSHQNSRENDWSRRNYSGKRFNNKSFRGNESLGHSDRGLLGKKRGRNPVDLDVSFKSNRLVGKPVASPTSPGIRRDVSVAPRCSKARRVLVTDKNEKASVNEGNGNWRTHSSDEALVFEGSRQSTRQTTPSEIKKKYDNYSTPSSSDSGGKLGKVRFVDGVVQDSNNKITDTCPEPSTHDSEAKGRSTVHTAEKISSFSEALKDARDDTDIEHYCNMDISSTEEDVIGGDKILKSHEDVLDRTSTGRNAGEALMQKVTEKEEIGKTKTKFNTSPVMVPVSCPTVTDLSMCSEGGTHFAGEFMCSVGSQPCEDEVIDCIPSKNLLMMEVNAGFEERKSISSLGYGEKDFEKSSPEAYLSAESDRSKGRLNGVVSSTPLDIANVSRDPANANNSFSGDCANANSFTGGRYTTTMVKSPDTSVVIQVESTNLSHCENVVKPSVENVSRKEFMETKPLNSAAEMPDNLDSDEGKQTCVNKTSSFLTNVAVNGSSNVLPVENSDGFSHVDESDLAMAVSSEVCLENLSSKRYVPDEDLGLASRHPAEIPFVDQFGGSDTRGLKAYSSEPNVSLNKDITDGASACLVERDVSQKASTFCDKFPSSSAFVVERNLANGTNGIAGNETVTGAESGLHETQPCSTVSKFLRDDCFGWASSGATGSVRNLSLAKNLEKDSSRVSSCQVPDTSASPCHISPLVPQNEQIRNGTSIQTNYIDSQVSIMHKEKNCAENIEVETQEEKEMASGGNFKYRTPGTDIIAASGDSVSPCDSSSSLPRRSFRQIRSEIHVTPVVYETSKCKEKSKSSGGTSKYRTAVHDPVAVSGDSVFPRDSLCSSPRLSFSQMRSNIHFSPVVDETSKVNKSEKEDILLDTSQERIMKSNEVTNPVDALSLYPCVGQTSPGTDVVSSKHPMIKYPGGDLVEKPSGVPIEKLTDVGSQENHSPGCAKIDMFDDEALSSDGKVSRTEIPGGSGVRLSKSHSHADVKFSLPHVKDQVVSVPHPDSQSKTSLSSRGEMQKRKKKANNSTQKIYPRSLHFVPDTKKDANPPTHVTKRHTWHRKSDTSASPFVADKPSPSTLSTQQRLPKVTAQSSNSYVRKGNSLLRKPSHGSPVVALGMPRSVVQLNRFTDEDKSMGSSSRVDVDKTSFPVKTGEMHTLERQSRPPSDSSTSKVSNFIATSSGKCALSHSVDHLTTGLPESIMDSATSGEANVSCSSEDTLKTSDTLIQTGYTSDCQPKRGAPKLDSSNLKRMVYVKRKANQLVAASDSHGANKSQIPSSDGYFKRSKNQLVRNSEGRINQSISLPNDALDPRAAANVASEKSPSSAFSDSAVMRPFKQSKFSLVWTQNDPQSRIPIAAHMRYQKILPQLVPWKRVTYWKRLMNTVSTLRNGSYSNISRKLSMMRKRHTVYTRSTNGYSLRKSKVLSIGGSLKWSKSIERDSKKANEEATLAVAAFSKKESEMHSGQSNTRTRSRSHLARERVFRFGSLRYKMDPSRRTLQRISDVDSPDPGPFQNGKGAKRPIIPNRLVIGNEEYVRVGNGNQLVRDPKKRTRALANEKVRWSLHKVRLRLAKKKKKYCQFFTRFGKCNKDDGKCPYVHDPSKIAVCTKFLNGLCVNSNCKLTHKVIPERMPDCSYFLQGLCNNEACPYRHVHVNPSAVICDGFLKGYCSDGDECRKKHSYTCPVFEATGSCSQGAKCKLHHPKNQSKGRKRKRPDESSQKNARGRYFGSTLHKGLSESEPMVLDRRSTDDFGMEGLDFIVLGATEYDEAGGNNGPDADQSTTSSDSEAPFSMFNLITPVALMQ